MHLPVYPPHYLPMYLPLYPIHNSLHPLSTLYPPVFLSYIYPIYFIVFYSGLYLCIFLYIHSLIPHSIHPLSPPNTQLSSIPESTPISSTFMFYSEVPCLIFTPYLSAYFFLYLHLYHSYYHPLLTDVLTPISTPISICSPLPCILSLYTLPLITSYSSSVSTPISTTVAPLYHNLFLPYHCIHLSNHPLIHPYI